MKPLRLPHYNFTTKTIPVDLSPYRPITPISEVKKFIINCLESYYVPTRKAELASDNLLYADCRGIFHKGIASLESHLDIVASGKCKPKTEPVIQHQHCACAVVDGNNGMGFCAANFSINLAIEKAKKFGVGLVTTKRTHNYGIAEKYTSQAAEKNCIAFATSNAALPKTDSNLSTYSTTISIPGLSQPFSEDLSPGMHFSSAFSEAIHFRTAVKAETFEKLFSEYNLCTFLLSEILARLNGDGFSHCFIVLDPRKLLPNFEEEIQKYLIGLKSDNVIFKSDQEKANLDKVQKEGGIAYSKSIHMLAKRLSNKLNVEPLKSFWF